MSFVVVDNELNTGSFKKKTRVLDDFLLTCHFITKYRELQCQFKKIEKHTLKWSKKLSIYKMNL